MLTLIFNTYCTQPVRLQSALQQLVGRGRDGEQRGVRRGDVYRCLARALRGPRQLLHGGGTGKRECVCGEEV